MQGGAQPAQARQPEAQGRKSAGRQTAGEAAQGQRQAAGQVRRMPQPYLYAPRAWDTPGPSSALVAPLCLPARSSFPVPETRAWSSDRRCAQSPKALTCALMHAQPGRLERDHCQAGEGAQGAGGRARRQLRHAAGEGMPKPCMAQTLTRSAARAPRGALQHHQMGHCRACFACTC